MNSPASPFDILAAELGAVAGRIERESALRVNAIVAELRRVDAERELRLSNLERMVADKLASVKDGERGERGQDGTSITIDDVTPLIVSEVKKTVAVIPIPKDGRDGKDGQPGLNGKDGQDGLPGADGKDGQPGRDGIDGRPGERGADGVSVTVDDVMPIIFSEVGKAVAAIPVPKDGAPGRDGIDGKDGEPGQRGEKGDPGEPGLNGKDGRDGADGKDGLPGKDGIDGKDGAEGQKGDPGERGEKGADGRDGKDGAPGVDGKDGQSGPQGERGEKGDPGERGPAGLLPMVQAWADGVHYAREVRSYQGATYQALRDTGHAPPHDDWICLAAAGAAAKSPKVIGTFDPMKTDYAELNIVALNGAAFIAKRDNPGNCPGDGWQVISTQGKTGKPGERGKVGPQGLPGPSITEMSIDKNGMITLVNADGSTVRCDLYPILSKIS